MTTEEAIDFLNTDDFESAGFAEATGMAIEALEKEDSEDFSFWVEDTETGKEVNAYDVAPEYPNLCQCDIEGFAITDDGHLIICDECGAFEYLFSEKYVAHKGERRQL